MMATIFSYYELSKYHKFLVKVMPVEITRHCWKSHMNWQSEEPLI